MFLFSTIIEVFIFFSLTAISNAIGILKNIFITKKQLKPAYIVTFIDSIVFATVMKKISSGSGLLFILVYSVGRVIGTWLGDRIENRLAFGILEVELLLNDGSAAKKIADELRDLGYSVGTMTEYGYHGKKRYKLNIVIKRKEMERIEEVVSSYGYDEPTMKIKEISKVSGKFISD